MNVFEDQLGNKVELKSAPERIVSLVPSQTELLYHLGLTDRVVGITRFCIHPNEWFTTKTRIGGTKDVHIDRVHDLNPDLIIGNKEENTRSDIESLESIAPVWISDVNSLSDAYDMIARLSTICEVQEKGASMISNIRENFGALLQNGKGKKVLYLIWKDPIMGVASSTFIHHIIEEVLGFENCLAAKERYPIVETDDLEITPDFIFLSSEPYPFKEKHVHEMKRNFPNAEVVLVNGEYFSWYGSRLIDAPKYFMKLFKELKLH